MEEKARTRKNILWNIKMKECRSSLLLEDQDGELNHVALVSVRASVPYHAMMYSVQYVSQSD